MNVGLLFCFKTINYYKLIFDLDVDCLTEKLRDAMY